MIHARLDEITKMHPFEKIEYVYSNGQIKSVIIDIEGFLSIVEILEVESNVGIVHLTNSQGNELETKAAAEMTPTEKRAFAKSLKGRYKNHRTDSESFAAKKKAEIELEERKFKSK